MKFNEETMNAALASYMNNEFWRSVYEDAPEMAQKRLRVAFWASRHLDEREDLDNYRAYRESVEREMTYEDASYLADRFPEGAGKTHYRELRDRLEMASILTDDKLDEAMDIMTEDWSPAARQAIEKTRAAMKEVRDDPFIRYEWLWKAVGGSGEDCDMMGDLFDHGHGVDPDEDLAFFWFRRGALAGWGESCCRLAAIYENEASGRFDMSRALFWFREALRRGCVQAKISLGARLTLMDVSSWTNRRNPEIGFRLLKSAVLQKEDAHARYWLGRCYEEGVGTAKHLESARSNYAKAVRQKDGYFAEEALERVKEALREQNRRRTGADAGAQRRTEPGPVDAK